MGIEWFDATKGIPTATIAPYGITLNAAAALQLEGVSRVRLGYDPGRKAVYIQPVEASEEGFSVPPINDKRKTARISCREFIQFLSMRAGLAFESSQKFYVTSSDNALVIDLTQKLPSLRQKKGVRQ